MVINEKPKLYDYNLSKDAPTNISCKKCKNNIRTGYKCINCGAVMHKSCAKLSNAIQINDKQRNCCSSENTSDMNMSVNENVPHKCKR